MGGSSSQTTTQQSSTEPWKAAQPMLQQILGQLSPQIANSGLTTAQSGAIGQLTANGQAGNPYASGVGNVASTLLSGGGATSQNGTLQSNLDAYRTGMQPYTAANYSSLNDPSFRAALNQIATDTSDNVRSAFAAGGRSFSGMEGQSIARGIAAGQAPMIAAQYNQDVATRQGALNNVYNGGNTTAGAITGNNQQDLSNRVQGVSTANDALSANNWGPNQVLQAQQYLQSIPASNLGLLAQIGIPIAGLGSSSSGTSNTQSQMSGAQQFATIMSGIGSLMPKSPMSFNFGG